MKPSLLRRLCLLPSDGIGPKVIAQARTVLAALAAIRDADATLFGAGTTPPNIPGYFSPLVRLRQRNLKEKTP